jgi:hypothetical protein
MRRLNLAFPTGLVPLLAIAALVLAAGCGPRVPGAVVKPAVGVHYSTGDPKGLIDEHLGLKDAHLTRATLRAGGGIAYDGAVHVACGPVPDHPSAFRLRLTADDPATLDLSLVLPHFEHYGLHEAEARLERLGPAGGFEVSTGRGEVEIVSAVHRAGRRGASGTFTAELAGAAGGGTVEGRFESCYYFD